MPKPKIYVAGPFFTSPALDALEAIEHEIAEILPWAEIFRPREGLASRELGAVMVQRRAYRATISKLAGDPAEHLKRLDELYPLKDLPARVFRDNVSNLDDASLLIALTDDWDVGTIWEMGYGHAIGLLTLTFSAAGYDSNLMLTESCAGHLRGVAELSKALGIIEGLIRDPSAMGGEALMRLAAFCGGRLSVENEGGLRKKA